MFYGKKEDQELDAEDKEELAIYNKETEEVHEKYGYIGLVAIGLVFSMIALYRIIAGEELTFNAVNIGLLAIGVLFVGGAYYAKHKNGVSEEEMKFLQEREEEQMRYYNGTYGFSHDIEPDTVRNRPK